MILHLCLFSFWPLSVIFIFMIFLDVLIVFVFWWILILLLWWCMVLSWVWFPSKLFWCPNRCDDYRLSSWCVPVVFSFSKFLDPTKFFFMNHNTSLVWFFVILEDTCDTGGLFDVTFQMCHKHGMMHQDLTLENFLFPKTTTLKTIDFRLLVFFKPGNAFSWMVHCLMILFALLQCCA